MIVIVSVPLASANDSTFAPTGYRNLLLDWHNCKIIKKETDLYFGLVGHDTDRFSGNSVNGNSQIKKGGTYVDKYLFLQICLTRKKFH